MKYILVASALLAGWFTANAQTAREDLLSVSSQNPHYFTYKGKPTLIIGSGEHYGAVINADFDYKTYLRTLSQDGLNVTRLFPGAYFEVPGAFGIEKNTLAPKPEKLMLPWARSDQPGYVLGGMNGADRKFDLSKWNDAYFERLTDFMREAEKNNVIVEITLFSSYYGAGWAHAPFNRQNNINGTESIEAFNANTPFNGNILTFQEQYVRKLVRELNRFPNLYFEIQNEPWADQKDTVLVLNEYFPKSEVKDNAWKATLEVVAERANDWQRRVAGWVKDEESTLPNQHIISQNISNFHYPVSDPDPTVSLFTFHYAFPQAVTENYHLGKPVGFNETGFAGSRDNTYRRQAWRFILAGGALFNHLDYSFSVGAETGTDTTYKAPGGGSVGLRKQLGLLKQYMEQLDLVRLRPTPACVVASPGAQAWGMHNGRSQWVIYTEPLAVRKSELILELPRGSYRADWTDVETGELVKSETFSVAGRQKKLQNDVMRDLVIKIIRQ